MSAAERPRPTLGSQLAAWYSTLLTLCVALFSVAVGLMFDGHVRGELDRQVHEDVELAAHALHEDGAGGLGWPPGFLAADFREDEGGGHAIEVWTAGGARLLAGGSMEPPVLGAPAGEEAPRTVSTAAGRVRVKTERVRVGGREVLVRAAISEQGARTTVRRLWMHLLGFSIVIVWLASWGGHVLVRRLLGPLSRLASQARRITAEHLHERLPPAPTEELEQLREAFNETLARLERSFDQLRRFTADASHELRTPLTALRTVGEVGLRGARTAEEYREVIGSMLEEADRLARLADELLALARAESGEARLKPVELDLAAVARDVVGELSVLAEEREQALETALDEPARVVADRLSVRQALINLVDNAIKYAPERSRIVVRSGGGHDEAWVEVTDEGPGIAPSHRERVFDRFYRVDKSRSREVGGTGLGLSLVKWAAEANGGRVALQSEEGRGSTFRLVLPSRPRPAA